MRTEISILLVLLAVTCGVAAEEPTLDVMVSGDTFRVGDRVAIRVVARGGENLLWGELQLAADAEGRWALVEGPREIPEARPPAWEAVVAPLELGELELPSPLAVVRSDDGTTSEVSAAKLPAVTVVSVLPEEGDAEPQPLRDPVGVTGFPWEWVLPLVALLLVPLVGVAWMVFGVSRRLLGQAVSGRPVVSPLDEFEDLLSRLGDRIGREPSEGVCDRLASGLRHYLQRQCGEPAEDMTSFELRLLVRRLGWPEGIQRGIHGVMTTVDRVRFGRIPSDESEMRTILGTSAEAARAIDALLSPEQEAAAEEVAG